MSPPDSNPDGIKSTTSQPPWYIYESQLSNVVVGVPLWRPGPYKEVDGSLSPIRLADVGYMFQKGRFVTLFNAACPSSSKAHGLFPQERLRDTLIDTSTEDRLNTLSVHARVTNIGADKDLGNVQILADLSSRDTGAAMILPGPDGTAKMKSFDLRDEPFYSDYCFTHCESWLQAAGNAAAKHVQLKDLIFVTGIDMVKAWALFAFPSSSDPCSVDITAGPTTMSATRQDSPPSNSFNCPPIMTYGPLDRREYGTLDQCVVIRRFKMHRMIDKVRWQMNKGLRRLLLKRTEVLDAVTIDGDPESDDAEEEDAESLIEGSETDDKKSRRRKRRQTTPSPEFSVEDNDLQGNRRGGGGGGDPGPGGAGGGGSTGADASSAQGLPPGNGGRRRDTESGKPATGGGNGHGGNASKYTLNDNGIASFMGGDVGTTPEWYNSEDDDNSSNDSDDGTVDSERLEPLDALLEYILEACPLAVCAGAGDHDLTSFRPVSNWDSSPARLRTVKPEIHLQSNGLALLKGSVYYRTLASHDLLHADLDELTASFKSQPNAEASKVIENATIFPPQSIATPLESVQRHASFKTQPLTEASKAIERPKPTVFPPQPTAAPLESVKRPASFKTQPHTEASKAIERPKPTIFPPKSIATPLESVKRPASFKTEPHTEASKAIERPKPTIFPPQSIATLSESAERSLESSSTTIERPTLQIYWTSEWNNHVHRIDGHMRNVSWKEFRNPSDSGPWFAIVYYRELEYGRGSSATLRGAKNVASQVAMKTMCPEKHDAIIDNASRKEGRTD